MPITYFERGRFPGPSDVFVATTCYSGKPSPNYVASWTHTLIELGRRGIAADYCLHTGDCHVDDARNAVLREFMKTECPVLLFIDDDVGWRAEDFIKIINLPRHDIVAGVYPLKQDTEEFPVRVAPGTELWADKDGLVEVEGGPTGFMAIRRPVIEAMMEKNRNRRYLGRRTNDTDPYTIVFERSLVDGHRWSGDYNFCRDARKIGFKVYVDPEMVFTHEGSKIWAGTLGDHWRRTHGVPDPELDAAFLALKAGRAEPKHYADLFRLSNNPFAAGPTMLAAVHDIVANGKRSVLETGSGLTTVAMGMAADRSGGRVFALEHDLDWYRRTNKLLAKYGVKSAKVFYSPLIMNNANAWYTVPADLPKQFDLVVCDGPPRRFGREALWEKLGDRIVDADWIMDDADDPEELAVIQRHAEGREIKVFGNPDARQFAVAFKIASKAASSAA